MRIQHNIMAMNAYRNYNTNTSALSKNLEKLSSGYKINRAGDDAAGLAISEKMRAQITGLDAAQKNVKDGISLVKTAEGAMQEVQDMLNRMDYLATQSANGTYDNDVDRAALQKEVEQLKTEINRIADSANFNGIKLMDGSLDEDGRRATTKTIFSGSKMANNTLGTAPDATTGFGAANGKGGIMLTGQYANDTDGAVGVSDNSIRYHQEAKGEGKTSFTVELGGLNYTADPGTTIKDLVFGLKSGTKAADFAGTATGTVNNPDNNNVLFLNDGKSTSKNENAARLEYDVTAGSNGITSEDIAKAIEKAINENDGKVYIEPAAGGNRIEYTVTRDGDNLIFNMTNKGYDDAVAATDADTTNKLNYFQGNYNFSVHYQTETGTTDDAELRKKFIDGTDDHYLGNTSTCNINEGSKSSDTIYAQAYIRFANTAVPAKGINAITDIVADGKGLQIGDEYYIFAHSDEVYNTEYQDNVKVVDIRDLNNLAENDGTEEVDLRKALTRLSEAAKDNEMFDVQVENRGTILAINERTTYTGGANLTEKDWGFEKQIQKFDSAVSTTTVEREAGTALTLQIGDTADDFNQMKVSIGDLHTKAMGIADIDIGKQDTASDAIQTIKDAINYVSSVRGNLGAVQNRLEHTQNNLGVMAENIQDAESTIRDTDVANEMMSYVKNNILVQSAQAMLAQANQVPQGVLQLLG